MNGKWIKCINGNFTLFNLTTVHVYSLTEMKKSSEFYFVVHFWRNWTTLQFFMTRIIINRNSFVNMRTSHQVSQRNHIVSQNETKKIRMWKLSHDFTIIPWLIALWWLPIFHIFPQTHTHSCINIYYYMNHSTGHCQLRMLFIIYMRLTSQFFIHFSHSRTYIPTIEVRFIANH